MRWVGKASKEGRQRLLPSTPLPTRAGNASKEGRQQCGGRVAAAGAGKGHCVWNVNARLVAEDEDQ